MKVMSGLDARFLYYETPTAHMHTMKVVVVDTSGRREPLTAEGLRALIEDRLRLMPVLRRRVMLVARGAGNPVVLDDPDFDLSRHLRVTTAAAPGGTAELDDVIAEIAGTQLPRDRPLWELTVVEGLAEGRLAFVMKLHHALADGVASVAMMENAFIADDAHAVVEPYNPEPIPTARTLYRASATSALRATRLIPRVVKQSLSGARRARAMKRSETAMLPGAFAGPRTPFNAALTADRVFASLAIPLPRLMAAKKAAGVSLNDTFLSLCGGAARRYLDRMGRLPAHSLVASVPMATRIDLHRLVGNHVDNLFVPLRTDIADPIERARAIHESSVAARKIRSELGSDLFEWRSGVVPVGIHGLMSGLWGSTHLADHLRSPVNMVASCVRGPRQRLEFDGGVVTSMLSCGPILEGIGLNITAWSYIDTMYLSLLGCSASLPDPRRLARDIEAESLSWESKL